MAGRGQVERSERRTLESRRLTLIWSHARDQQAERTPRDVSLSFHREDANFIKAELRCSRKPRVGIKPSRSFGRLISGTRNR